MKPVILRPGIGNYRPSATLYYGQDVRETLRLLPEASVHAVCTSPPYWGLRNYGAEGQIGLENTPEAFVAALVDVFREVRRVLRRDGTLWLNLGDSYTSGGRTTRAPDAKYDGAREMVTRVATPEGLKPKDLIGIPWRVALALQADGWYLRQDIIWHKPNPMPESVRDRCTKSHEYVFLLAHPDSGGDYYYDADAIAEPAVGKSFHDLTGGRYTPPGQTEHTGSRSSAAREVNGRRNRRTVWTVPTSPYLGAHFAVWPPELVRPMILAGCPAGGTVLDPFSGSATTGMVALQEGRNYIGCDLNPGYLPLAERRIREEPAPAPSGSLHPESCDISDLLLFGESHTSG